MANTVKYKTGSSRQLKPSGTYATRIYDVFVSGSALTPTWIKFANGNVESDDETYLLLSTDSLTGANATASSTNVFSFCEGFRFPDGCYISTGATFGYATITFGVDMS